MIDDPLTLLDFNLSLINQNTLIFPKTIGLGRNSWTTTYLISFPRQAEAVVMVSAREPLDGPSHVHEGWPRGDCAMIR